MLDILVMYPNSHEAHFDDAYYLEQHASLVISLMAPWGLKYLRIIKGTDQGAPYYLVAQLGFESQKIFQRAIDEVGGKVFGDVPNFTNVEPLIQVGQVVTNGRRD